MNLFSVVLSWPSENTDEANLRLLVPSAANRPIADRIRPGQTIEITEGPNLLAFGFVERDST